MSGLTRTRPFLSLSLKTPQGKPQRGPRTIFRDKPPTPTPLAMLSQEPGLAKPPAAAVGDGERQSCQRGRRMPQLRFHIQSPRLHLSDLPAGKPSPLSSLKTTKLIIFLPAVPPTPTPRARPPTFPGQGAGEPSGSICWTPSTFAPWDGGGGNLRNPLSLLLLPYRDWRWTAQRRRIARPRKAPCKAPCVISQTHICKATAGTGTSGPFTETGGPGAQSSDG